MTNFEIALFSAAINMAAVWWLSKPYCYPLCGGVMEKYMIVNWKLRIKYAVDAVINTTTYE